MTIFSPKQLNVAGSVCTKILWKNFEISISMDDSCGDLNAYSRSDLRVYTVLANPFGKNGPEMVEVDVTHLFFPEYVVDRMVKADAKTLLMLMLQIDIDPPELILNELLNS